MTAIDRRVAMGGGSCARCRALLDLTAVESDGVWYCSTACRDGHPNAPHPHPRVPEPWLYARPHRFFAKRRPKELRTRRPSAHSRSSTEK
jgi:hypothetical protein